ncbi:MAG TPA: hypothetical protein VIV58_02935, partial [Kofleriaceae bacterium]
MRLAVGFALICITSVAHAQAVDRRYAEEPTDGLALPGSPISGDVDARTVTLNSAGLAYLEGPALAIALDLENADVGTSSGPGFGIYAGDSLFGGVLPKIGLGLGL